MRTRVHSIVELPDGRGAEQGDTGVDEDMEQGLSTWDALAIAKPTSASSVGPSQLMLSEPNALRRFSFEQTCRTGVIPARYRRPLPYRVGFEDVQARCMR